MLSASLINNTYSIFILTNLPVQLAPSLRILRLS